MAKRLELFEQKKRKHAEKELQEGAGDPEQAAKKPKRGGNASVPSQGQSVNKVGTRTSGTTAATPTVPSQQHPVSEELPFPGPTPPSPLIHVVSEESSEDQEFLAQRTRRHRTGKSKGPFSFNACSCVSRISHKNCFLSDLLSLCL